MIPQEIIRKKRENTILSNQEIEAFVNGLTDSSFSDSHIAAMSMAIFLNGMNEEETLNLTKAMTHSGNILKWDSLIDDHFICDKHSTAGVIRLNADFSGLPTLIPTEIALFSLI